MNNDPIIIIGPQASGKTHLAQELARQRGEFIEVDCRDLDTQDAIATILLRRPETVICDGIPETETLDQLKSLITAGGAMVKPKYGRATMTTTPRFIFCTDTLAAFAEAATLRRFHVIDLRAR